MKKKKRSELIYSRVVTQNGLGIEIQSKWFQALGKFDFIRPQEAAGLWGVAIREAMKRLHAMLGNFLEIPPGAVELYRPAHPEKPPAEEFEPKTCSVCKQSPAKCKGKCMKCYMRERHQREKGKEQWAARQ